MLHALTWALVTGLGGTVAVALALVAFGTRRRPEPLAAVNAVFDGVQWDPPALRTLAARDGAPLAWRSYPAGQAVRTAVLVHGSTADSRAMHALATYLAERGTRCHAIDVRGHGGSGRVRGDIAYEGQLEDDLADLVRHLRDAGEVQGPLWLLGHSSGGGFSLRVAAGAHGGLFDGFVLAAPMIHHAPPLSRPRVGGWAVPFLPRIVGLTTLHALGLRFWEHLPVIAFATPAGDATRTPTYSFRLQRNFRPPMRWADAVRAVRRPTTLLIGDADELFDGQAYRAAITPLNARIAVHLLAGVAHADWYVATPAFEALHQALCRPPAEAPAC
ncbi:alpha/beta fold hydrolase [Piscinibacter sakaiensis]|uniref:Lysophospholipase n=1 Tax=Piscinibacter sakaiensis TaxID=1547922 RepID=A0A0K8P0R7_PISS1|nr:alpha/beta hydrolase [Piscinibacter sakaiensis]GAP36144.1 lysophospholipase [Piscinibacter sakaiensis]